MVENSQVYPMADGSEPEPAGCLLQFHTCSSAQPGSCKSCFLLVPPLLSHPGTATCAKQDRRQVVCWKLSLHHPDL